MAFTTPSYTRFTGEFIPIFSYRENVLCCLGTIFMFLTEKQVKYYTRWGIDYLCALSVTFHSKGNFPLL